MRERNRSGATPPLATIFLTFKNKIMKKFKVTVTETLTKEFFVDAEDREDATNKVATEYYKASADEYLDRKRLSRNYH